jgi:hypothetical protein
LPSAYVRWAALEQAERDLSRKPAPEAESDFPAAQDSLLKERLGIPDAQTFEEYKARQGGFPPGGDVRVI